MSGSCVEACHREGRSGLRDSKQVDAGEDVDEIWVDAGVFDTFQDELIGEAAEGSNGEIVIDRLEDGWVAFRSLSTGVTLRFDADEFEAFVDGVRAGDFRPVLV